MQRQVGRFVRNEFSPQRFSAFSTFLSQQLQSDPIFVSVSPGARTLELRTSESGNMLTTEVMNTIQRKLEMYEANTIIGAMIITSENPDLFSNGLDNNEVENSEKKRRIAAASKLSSYISSMDKAVIAVYSGSVAASAYSVFASARYRLGTPSTKFRIEEDLSRGNLPLGGLAAQIARSCPEGVAIGRYLAISQRVLTAHDMFSLGLLTHIVEEEPHVSLVHALAHTMPIDDHMKAVQSMAVDASSVKGLLDTMDVTSEFKGSIMDDASWNEIMLVQPHRVDYEDFFDGDVEGIEDLEDISDEVSNCFMVDDISEVRRRLQDNKSKWSRGLIDRIDSIPTEVLQSWFVLTKQAVNVEFNVEMEEAKLLQ